MATEGFDDLDIFECAVCFNNMLDRSPRSLKCLHSFCETCLQKLVEDNNIICPTCRHVTEVQDNDTETLPVNFLLQKVHDMKKTHQQQPTEVLDNSCEICKIKNREYICKECDILICLTCKSEHLNKEDSHSVFDLCYKHNDAITHLCLKCTLPLCATCMEVWHQNHQEHVEEISTAIMVNLHECVENLQDTMKGELKQISEYPEKVKELDKINRNTEKELLYYKKYHSDKLKEIDKLILITNENKKVYDSITESCVQASINFLNVTASVYNLPRNSPGLCAKYAQLQQKANDIRALREKITNRFVTKLLVLNEQVPTPLVKSSVEGDFDTIVKKAEKKRGKQNEISDIIMLEHQELLLDIPRSKKINCAEQLAFIGNDVVSVTYIEPRHVIRVNQKGDVVDRYYPSVKTGSVTGVAVYDNNIYIVQPEVITVVSAINKETIGIYKPELEKNDTMKKILVKSKSTLFLFSSTRVYKYKPDQEETNVVRENISNAYDICMVVTHDGLRFLISHTTFHSHRREYHHEISVYDDTWTLLGQHTIAVWYTWCNSIYISATQFGTFLITDSSNGRICHYNWNGEYLCNVMSISNPAGIAYKHPYMWVSGSKGKYLKCFLMKENEESSLEEDADKEDKSLADSGTGMINVWRIQSTTPVFYFHLFAFLTCVLLGVYFMFYFSSLF